MNRVGSAVTVARMIGDPHVKPRIVREWARRGWLPIRRMKGSPSPLYSFDQAWTAYNMWRLEVAAADGRGVSADDQTPRRSRPDDEEIL